MKTPQEQMKIICKGAKECIGKEELMEKLEKSYAMNKPLTVKLGLDPSAPDIHLGHAVVLRKIRQMQDLGHQAVIIVGDFTGQIGDPTGKAKGRKALSKEQVRENATTYCEQIFHILKKENTTIRFNSEWLSALNFEDVLRLSATTTVARMLERDDFSNRYKHNVSIGLHEFFYPLMQAYDSVEIKADIELGGTDQTFNILMGRSLQKEMGQVPQTALLMPILEGIDGVEKMSKSLHNYIGMHDTASVMFKKVMEIPDELIIRYFELATDKDPDEIEKMKQQLQEGKNPKDVKFQLAKTITKLYHEKKEVEQAIEYYEAAFSKKSIPKNIPSIVLGEQEDLILDIVPHLVEKEYVKSKSEFMRLVKQGGVSVNKERLQEGEWDRVLVQGDVIKIGKKKFIKIIK